MRQAGWPQAASEQEAASSSVESGVMQHKSAVNAWPTHNTQTRLMRRQVLFDAKAVGQAGPPNALRREGRFGGGRGWACGWVGGHGAAGSEARRREHSVTRAVAARPHQAAAAPQHQAVAAPPHRLLLPCTATATIHVIISRTCSTRSTAKSTSRCTISLPPRRTASSAASFRTLPSSAPAGPHQGSQGSPPQVGSREAERCSGSSQTRRAHPALVPGCLARQILGQLACILAHARLRIWQQQQLRGRAYATIIWRQRT